MSPRFSSAFLIFSLLAPFAPAAFAEPSARTIELTKQIGELTDSQEIFVKISMEAYERAAEQIRLTLIAVLAENDPDHKLNNHPDLKDQVIKRSNEWKQDLISKMRQVISRKDLYEKLRVAMADVYAKYYSDDELEQLLAFHKTPLGKKFASISASFSHDIQQASLAIYSPEQMKLQNESILAIRTEMLQKLAAAPK